MELSFLFVTIFVGVMVFLMLFLYDLWSPVMAETTYEMESFINSSSDHTDENVTDIQNEARSSLSNIRNVWRYWPFVLLLFLLVWVIIATQKREPMYQSYGY